MAEILSTILSYGTVALTVLGALVAFVAVLAPLTKTDKDDKVLKALVWLHDLAVKLVPNAASKPRPTNSVKVHDHRGR